MPIKCLSIVFQELAALIIAVKPRRNKGYSKLQYVWYVESLHNFKTWTIRTKALFFHLFSTILTPPLFLSSFLRMYYSILLFFLPVLSLLFLLTFLHYFCLQFSLLTFPFKFPKHNGNYTQPSLLS